MHGQNLFDPAFIGLSGFFALDSCFAADFVAFVFDFYCEPFALFVIIGGPRVVGVLPHDLCSFFVLIVVDTRLDCFEFLGVIGQ